MWTCPKCGREFKNQGQGHYCVKPKTIDEYIALQEKPLRPFLQDIRCTIRAALPDAEERISWSMPTFWGGKNVMREECDSVRRFQTPHRPVSRPGGGGAVPGQAGRIRNQQGNHTATVPGTASAGADRGDRKMVLEAVSHLKFRCKRAVCQFGGRPVFS